MEYNTIYGLTITKDILKKAKSILKSKNGYEYMFLGTMSNGLGQIVIEKNDYAHDKLFTLEHDYLNKGKKFNLRKSALNFDKRLYKTMKEEFKEMKLNNILIEEIKEDNKKEVKSITKTIISNKIKTPDGTILESHGVHDFVQYKDKNGNYYAVDGGTEYLKRNYDVPDYEELSTYEEDGFESVRENFTWGTYGKSGKEPLKYLKLKDMETSHIEAILETQTHIQKKTKDIFKKELVYRVRLEDVESKNILNKEIEQN